MTTSVEHHRIVVVGGGQAGLSVSYHLRQHGLDHLVVDGSSHAGDTWRNRWDSLRLFTPARIDHLDGMPLPRTHGVPTKDEFADYLDDYEAAFAVPVRHQTRVTALSQDSGRFALDTTGGRLTADTVVVAMSSLQVPKIPDFAKDLDPRICSMHSSQYRNPDQLAEGPVLAVGVGNTGAEIAVEVAPDHETWLAGKETMSAPFRIDGWFGEHIWSHVVKAVFMHVLTTSTPVGRRARPRLVAQADPLLRERPKDLRRTGVQRVPRITGTRDGLPVAEDGTVLDVANVIWCTGFRNGFEDWIELPVLDEQGTVRHERGVVADAPGLYFVGLNFLYAKASETIPGVGRDAQYVVEHLASALGSTPSREQPLASR